MTSYILKRLLAAVGTLLIIMAVTFFLMNAVPGNPFLIINDYGTPLGVELIINHVGDCFD